jgi:peptide/nickel transport system substrate-binding protein/oligopeptide transport system substrate-binding protein
VRLLALALALAPALAACDGPDRGPRFRAAGATSPRAGGTLRFSAKDAVRTLDPAYAYDDLTVWPLHAMLDTLVDYRPGSTQLEARLAERWELSSDGRTYRFWLREGLRYADGAPIVALHFKHAIERVLALPDSPYQAFFQDVEGAAEVIARKASTCPGVRVIGERELEIRLTGPNPAFLYLLAIKIAAPLPAAHAEAAGDQLRRRPLASGPYRLAAWSEGERLVLERNPHYRDPARQRVERIVMLENIPRDVQFLMFERGELDLAERLSPADLAWLRDREDWAPYVQVQPQLTAFGARMDVRKKPFDDRRVRQALNYAVNKDYTTILLAGTTTPAHGLLPPGMIGRDDALGPYPYDPARARALLAEAGYGSGLVLPYTTFPDEEMAKVTASMQADLAAVGVRLEISLVSFPAYLTLLGKAEGGMPFSYEGWIADYPDPSAFLDPKFHSSRISDEGSVNDSFYRSPELDRVLDAARAELDEQKRAALYRSAERILYDDAPWIWNYHQLITEVRQPYVRDYTLHPVWLRDLTTAWLDLGPDGEPVPR